MNRNQLSLGQGRTEEEELLSSNYLHQYQSQTDVTKKRLRRLCTAVNVLNKLTTLYCHENVLQLLKQSVKTEQQVAPINKSWDFNYLNINNYIDSLIYKNSVVNFVAF